MSKKLVAAQIGCGAFAQDQHGPNCLRNPNIAKIKWACDTNKETAKTYANKVSAENVRKIFGLEITTVTNAKTKEEALELFRVLGFPMKKDLSDSASGGGAQRLLHPAHKNLNVG